MCNKYPVLRFKYFARGNFRDIGSDELSPEARIVRRSHIMQQDGDRANCLADERESNTGTHSLSAAQ